MEIKIVGPLFPETYLDDKGAEQTRGFYSFTVDGVPSMKWYPECRVPGLPIDYYVRRCVKRLEAGQSAEAFGASPVVSLNGKPVALESAAPDFADVMTKLTVAGVPDDLAAKAIDVLRRGSKAGRGSVREVAPKGVPLAVVQNGRTKMREAKPTYRYTLDDIECEEDFPTEAAAKRACALRAFMTRHKLGQIPAAQKALETAFPGRACRVWACAKEHGICATVDGERYSIGWELLGGTWTATKFKKVEPDETEE